MENALRGYPRLRWSLAPALILLTLFWGFFERPVLFHDEIINVYKAQRPIVFDYAARPVFYLLNYFSASVLGDHPLSLSFVMLLVSLVGGWLSFLLAKRYYGYAAGIAAAAAYCWLGWIHTTGISAMAHMLPATLTVLALYLYMRKQEGQVHWLDQIWLSLLLWAMLLSHPTAVAYFLAFFGLIAFDLVESWRGRRITFQALLSSGACWVLISVAVWIAIEAFYATFSGGSYAGAWLRSLEKTASSGFSKYFQPYSYYFQLFAQRFWILIVALLAALAWLVVSRLVGQSKADAPILRGDQGGGTIAVKLVVFSVVSICIVSTQTWKFERVAATFAPVASLGLVCVTFYALGQARRGGAVLKPLFATLIVAVSGYIFVQDSSSFASSLHKHRNTYSSFLEVVRASESEAVAYVGDWSDKARRRIPLMSAAGTGRQLKPAGTWPATRSDAETLVKKLERDGRRHLLVDLGKDGRGAETLRSYLYSTRSQRLASYWRGGYELWSLTPLDLQPVVSGLEAVKEQLASAVPVFLRYDRVSRRPGGSERQVYFEILGSGVEEAEQKVLSSFESAGYTGRKGWEDAAGIRMAFTAPGEPAINVLIRGKDASPPFRRADGTASVYIRQPVD